MAAIKGRRQRARGHAPEFELRVRVEPETVEILDAGAKALGISRAAYVELFIRHTPVDESGLPVWAREFVTTEQLPVLTHEGEEIGQLAA